MNPKIKFDHTSDTLAGALGVKQSTTEVSNQISDVVSKWAEDRTSPSGISILAEHLHKGLPYELILVLVTQFIYEELNGASREFDLMQSLDIQRKVRDN